MAKKRGARRHQQNIRRVLIQTVAPLLTLGSKVALVAPLFAASDSEYLLMNMNITWSWTAITAQNGPISCGVAADGYTAAQVEECLEAITNISLGNKIAQEQANRIVRQVGTLSPDVVTTGTKAVLNDGKPVYTKLNWKVPIGDVPQVYVYNQASVALDTGSSVLLQGWAWIKFI